MLLLSFDTTVLEIKQADKVSKQNGTTNCSIVHWKRFDVTLLLNDQQNKLSAIFNQQMSLEKLKPVILEYVLISLQLQEDKIKLILI